MLQKKKLCQTNAFFHEFQSLLSKTFTKWHNHIVIASIKVQPENLIASEVGRKHPKVNLGRTTKQTIHAVPMFTSTKKSTLPVCSYTRETRNPDRVDSFLAI